MNTRHSLLQKINTKQINATLHFPQNENGFRKAMWNIVIKGQQMGDSPKLLCCKKRLAATLQRPRKPVAHIEALFWQFMGRDVYIIERAKEEPGAN